MDLYTRSGGTPTTTVPIVSPPLAILNGKKTAQDADTAGAAMFLENQATRDADLALLEKSNTVADRTQALWTYGIVVAVVVFLMLVVKSCTTSNAVFLLLRFSRPSKLSKHRSTGTPFAFCDAT